jgi:hypothetical protein
MADKNQAAPEIYEGKIVALIGGASNQQRIVSGVGEFGQEGS